MRLSHNLASLNLFWEQNKILADQSQSLNRLSSGLKLNSAKDDPNGIGESENFKMQIKGMQMASRNAQDGISMLQTAEGGLDNITAMLQRARTLAVQASSGSNSQGDLNNIQIELSQTLSGASDIAKQTEYNGVKLLYKANGSPTDNDNTDTKSKINMLLGANTGDSVSIPKFNLAFNDGAIILPDGTNQDMSKIDVTQPGGADSALNMIDNALKAVTSVRSQYGALQNRFDSSYQQMQAIGDDLQAANSSLTDTDIAKEMMEYSKDNVLVQAGTAMMAQSNKFPQDILQILQNVKSR